MQPVSVQPMVIIGKMAEWSIAAVLKTVDLHGSGGSNPSLSATRVLLCAVLFSFRMQQSLSFNSQTNQKQTSFSPPSTLLPLISYPSLTHIPLIFHPSPTHLPLTLQAALYLTKQKEQSIIMLCSSIVVSVGLEPTTP